MNTAFQLFDPCLHALPGRFCGNLCRPLPQNCHTRTATDRRNLLRRASQQLELTEVIATTIKFDVKSAPQYWRAIEPVIPGEVRWRPLPILVFGVGRAKARFHSWKSSSAHKRINGFFLASRPFGSSAIRVTSLRLTHGGTWRCFCPKPRCNTLSIPHSGISSAALHCLGQIRIS